MDRIFRGSCDLILVNLSFFAAFVCKWLLAIPWGDQTSIAAYDALIMDGKQYVFYAMLFSIINLSVFSVAGFYTRNRTYLGRFKALLIAQAVAIAHLIFAAALFFFAEPGVITSTLWLCSWGVETFLLLTSRLWSMLWSKFSSLESTRAKAIDSKLVLVIGGAGYIGSALLPKLLNAGYRVRVLDLFIYGREPIAAYLDHPHVEIIEADFRQIDRVIEGVRGVDAVIHLGAIVGDPACALDEEMTIEVNLMASKVIADIAKAYGVRRFIFASTCSVYGASDALLDERSKLNPISLYARSKIACEKALRSLATDDFSPVFLRFSTIFGFSGRTRFDLVVNLLTAKAVFERNITLFGGDQWRPFLHVDDAALSVLVCLKAPVQKIHNEVFNVGADPLNYTLADVAKKIKAFVPEAQISELGHNTDRRNYRVNFAKISKVLGFQCQWTLERGIKQVIDAIQSGVIKDYREAEFDNAKFLRENKNQKISSRSIALFKALVENVEE